MRKQQPEHYIQLQEHWLSYLQHADQWIAEFTTGTVCVRLARLLLYLSELEPATEHHHIHLLKCEEIAAIIGTTTESVSRWTADFKRRGLLNQPDRASTQATIAREALEELILASD